MVDFRRINGRNVPIRNAFAWDRGSQSKRGRSTDATCYLRPCPQQCGLKIFFIRHNGGSVWIDPPLGHPWNKHKCMYPEELKAGRSLALTAPFQSIPRRQRAKQLLGVVTKAKYGGNRSTTILELASGEAERWLVTVKYDCEFLLGEIVIVDRHARTVARLNRFNLYLLLGLNRLT
jgi:hypothetical protein